VSSFWWPGLKQENAIYNSNASIPQTITDYLFDTINPSVQPTAMMDPNHRTPGAVAPYFWNDLPRGHRAAGRLGASRRSPTATT
jgi:hypothetical protein